MKPGVASLAAGTVVAAALLAPAGVARPDVPSAQRAENPALLGVVRSGGTGRPDLARLDPETLKPLPGRRVRVFDNAVPSLSPDRTRLVLGNSGTGSLTFVDVRRMRLLGHLWINPDGPVAATAWPTARRVLAAILRNRVTHASSVCCARVTVVTADPARRRIVRIVRVAADPVALARWRGGLAFVFAPVGRVGTARLAVADASGRIRSVALARLRAGRNATVRRIPGLAIDGARGRAFVVGAGEPVAEVDLRTLAVTYHELDRTLAVRRKDVGSGPARQARWLGNGLLAVSGDEFRASDFAILPAGLWVVDTSTWRVRAIDPGVGWFWFGAGTLLASEPWTIPRSERFGLVGWSPDGARRFEVLAGREVARVETMGGRAFVSFHDDHGGETSSYAVVDLRAGTVEAEVDDALPALVRP